MSISSAPAAPDSPHRWRFFRSGGFDQVRLESADDLCRLGELDQKLWAALACPVSGMALDQRTLEMLDSDGDGRIRVPELLAAAQWACGLLRDPALLTQRAPALPLGAINTEAQEGAALLASAQQILAQLGKPDAPAISVEEAADTARIFATLRFNGDGVVPPSAAGDDAALAVSMQDIMACAGADADRSGAPGLSAARIGAFFDDARAQAAWLSSASADALPLGADTAAAFAAYRSVHDKIEDYFQRCRLAAFDARAAAALNPGEAQYQALAGRNLAVVPEEAAAFPLAAVAAGRPLPLATGVNPAWSAAMAAFTSTVARPLAGVGEELDEAQWRGIQMRFAAHAAWQSAKPASCAAHMDAGRLQALLESDTEARLLALAEQDLAAKPIADAISGVERLARYCRDLFTLLNNFVSFRDFYTPGMQGMFQAGTLFLDGRACTLCLRVQDSATHATLATLGRLYLLYCDCVRRGSGETMTIAAAVTAGDSDNLMAGRNGVFYDRTGRDWDATIVKIVEHPISIRQAFWTPYKKIGRMIGQQMEKFAAAREQAAQSDAAARLMGLEKQAIEAKPAAPPAPAFDAGRFAGIFAAIGLALGAIGTALASVVTGFFALSWWQMPLAVGGLLLLVSGPSILMAWLKLRQRNLGPLLDASGWAVNTRALINIPFGGSLTQMAILPPGAQRAFSDPYLEKKRPLWPWVLLGALLAAALAWRLGYLP
jgi:hypothetical protein